MYSNLNLYYLQQLGITPWISKDTIQQDSVKLAVLVRSTASTKAQAFVKRVLSFLHLKPEEIKIITIDQEKSPSELSMQMSKHSPQAFLSLGVAESSLGDWKPQCSLVSSGDPDFLISHPLEKRTLFKDLQFINEKILT